MKYIYDTCTCHKFCFFKSGLLELDAFYMLRLFGRYVYYKKLRNANGILKYLYPECLKNVTQHIGERQER